MPTLNKLFGKIFDNAGRHGFEPQKDDPRCIKLKKIGTECMALRDVILKNTKFKLTYNDVIKHLIGLQEKIEDTLKCIKKSKSNDKHYENLMTLLPLRKKEIDHEISKIIKGAEKQNKNSFVAPKNNLGYTKMDDFDGFGEDLTKELIFQKNGLEVHNSMDSFLSIELFAQKAASQDMEKNFDAYPISEWKKIREKYEKELKLIGDRVNSKDVKIGNVEMQAIHKILGFNAKS
jgi:hypothetical protein